MDPHQQCKYIQEISYQENDQLRQRVSELEAKNAELQDEVEAINDLLEQEKTQCQQKDKALQTLQVINQELNYRVQELQNKVAEKDTKIQELQNVIKQKDDQITQVNKDHRKIGSKSKTQRKQSNPKKQ
ncbi:unnamed protein product (macronuclear) [Paramecium tetraurelia]|uniref:Uncharacterized protein n=2 Tax=Paramecium TaxID=5884 RepID=A0BEL9_PARTE|nr:uncharacterized protein GSPATT00028019001 [Paramecium tetraurelia]CAD8204639.1 unnamed protein product [Paramecium octaurelia]CAK56986.1 unnamed protein product [Paramecium tetraurelia]|eukprot:XP_001424384.1 hypothetical protein (macronuclear) [Paramecium tetraurelia strain d4-2]